MRSILLVGAGQLGSRYLQSMTQRLENTDFVVVEPNDAAAKTAQERYSQVASRVGNSLSFASGVAACKRSFDAAIIATTSAARLDALRDMLAVADVRRIVLEKVLFQDRPAYSEAERLLAAAGAEAWVNCPRRSFELYKGIRSFFGQEIPGHIEVSGGGWGLACNGIHFMDLAAFLFGSLPLHVGTNDLVDGAIPSKRAGYIEVEGTLSVLFDGGRKLLLTCSPGSTAGILVTIRASTKTVVVDESGGNVFYKDGTADWQTARFRMPLLSEFAGTMIEGIVVNGHAEIPTYSESMKIHLPFIDALCRHLGAEKCSIT